MSRRKGVSDAIVRALGTATDPLTSREIGERLDGFDRLDVSSALNVVVKAGKATATEDRPRRYALTRSGNELFKSLPPPGAHATNSPGLKAKRAATAARGDTSKTPPVSELVRAGRLLSARVLADEVPLSAAISHAITVFARADS